MTIKPVLVPDHDAASLRKLMDHFAEAATGPTRQQLTESRAAVTAARGVSEGDKSSSKKKSIGPDQNDPYEKGWRAAFKQVSNPYDKGTPDYKEWARGHADHSDQPEHYSEGVTEGEGMSRAAKGYEKYGRAGMQALAKAGREGRALDPVRQKYDQYNEGSAGDVEFPSALWVRSNMNLNNDQAHHLLHNFAKQIAAQHGLQDKVEKIYSLAQQAAISSGDHTAAGAKFKQLLKKYLDPGVTESSAGQPDVMRHKGDTTIKVVKRAGKPIGEIGIDAEASPGNGQYYVKLYDGSYDAVGFDTAAEALAELKAAISEGITETADGVKYGVFAKGGSVGSQRFRDDPLKTFDTKEEATADARRRRSALSPGERGYYRMGYVVKPINGAAQQVDEKSEAVRHGNNDRSIYHVDESVDPVEQLRADIKRFAQ